MESLSIVANRMQYRPLRVKGLRPELQTKRRHLKCETPRRWPPNAELIASPSLIAVTSAAIQISPLSRKAPSVIISRFRTVVKQQDGSNKPARSLPPLSPRITVRLACSGHLGLQLMRSMLPMGVPDEWHPHGGLARTGAGVLICKRDRTWSRFQLGHGLRGGQGRNHRGATDSALY